MSYRDRMDADRRYLKADAAETMNNIAAEIKALVPEFTVTFGQLKNAIKIDGKKVNWKMDWMAFDSEVWEAIRANPGYAEIEELINKANRAAESINEIMGHTPFGGLGVSARWAQRDLTSFFGKAKQAEEIFSENGVAFKVVDLFARLRESTNWRGYKKD